MTGNNHVQATKAFLLILIVLAAVIFGFWQTAKKNTQPQAVQVTIPEKKAPAAVSPFVDGAVIKVTVGSATVSAEVAQSEEKKRLGLGKREKLEKGTGMLFAFNNPGPCPNSCSFWNKDMLFPIDVVWIRDGVVVDVYEHLPAYGKAKDFIIMPKGEVNFVLEVPDRFVKENKIKAGDTVTYEPEKN